MRYALINDIRVEATPQVKALCPGCLKPVIAKCGSQRIHHWSHSGNKNCDLWWETETEWHRTWKQKFPDHWQELPMNDGQTGELHIADIRTEEGVIIEFQHSHIDPQERLSREAFYQNLIWVVDGTRLKYDFKRFVKEKKNFMVERPKIFRVDHIEEAFPSAWIDSPVPVIFDFLGTGFADDDPKREPLYLLYPKRIGWYVLVAELPRIAFIKALTEGQWLSRIKNFNYLWQQLYNQWEIQVAYFDVQNNITNLISRIQSQNLKRKHKRL